MNQMKTLKQDQSYKWKHRAALLLGLAKFERSIWKKRQSMNYNFKGKSTAFDFLEFKNDYFNRQDRKRKQ